ncbi:hypothetical protein HV819_07655 [Anaerococcus sp. AGMB00486]|uniref:Uncharacterized protein n=1 Tax=Anaerococcus faecalis TaxID=2742993 RepID=A0ABX2NAW9_9FIRM|nr:MULTISPECIES: hypothetical protein [Anaerococcus]MDY3007302.1 hypothetical protein [Anaerococcus porci]NVF11852.1 hypothetical protein [Anaerococcus faecalis]
MERFSILNPNLFEELLATCDSHLNAVMVKILNGEFGSGDINIKISLSVINDEMKIPREGDDFEIRPFVKPVIDFNVKSSLKKSFSDKGASDTDNIVIELSDKCIRIGKIDDGQMDFLD